MCLTIIEKELRGLYIQRSTLAIKFKRVYFIRADAKNKIPLSVMIYLQGLIDEADEKISTFKQIHLDSYTHYDD